MRLRFLIPSANVLEKKLVTPITGGLFMVVAQLQIDLKLMHGFVPLWHYADKATVAGTATPVNQFRKN